MEICVFVRVCAHTYVHLCVLVCVSAYICACCLVLFYMQIVYQCVCYIIVKLFITHTQKH